MEFFLTTAWAQDAGAAGSGGAWMQLLPLVLIFVVFYFLLIRPQTKRAKEHREMVGKLQAGDEVVTNGGMLGRIAEVGDNFMTLEIADGVSIKVQKTQVSQLMPKGTIKGS
jgi:preprotein translocase subunit YajC